jgi:diguanylate cyclase (GGDEF)-like protein/PAS domain S-box-containing protein
MKHHGAESFIIRRLFHARNLKIIIGVCAALAILAASWFAFLRKPPLPRTIRVGVDQSPPYYNIKADGSVEGLAVDVLNEAARRRGIHLIWKPLHDIPIDDVLKAGLVDMWPLLGATAVRRASFFISEPWLETQYVLASLREDPVRNPAEAAGKVVAHARLKFTAAVAGQYLQRSRIIVKHLRSEAIQAVCRGEASATLVESHVLDAILLSRPAGCETANFLVSSLVGAMTPLSIVAVPAAGPAATALREEITVLSRNGYLSGKLDEWSPFSAQGTRSIWAEEQANERSRVYVYCLIVIMVFAAFLAWTAFRAWSLKKAAERAEAGRREIQRRFTAFMETSPAASFMKDAAGRILYVNLAWSLLFGRRPEDIYGKSDFDLWPRETAQRLRATDLALLGENKPRQMVETLPISVTETRDLLVVKFPFSNERGERFVGGTAIDITQRQATIRELEASESRYRELFEHNPLPAWVYDRSTLVFLNVNAAAVARYGWTREDFLSGMTLRDVEDRAKGRHHITKHGLLLSVDVTSYELEYERQPACLMIIRDLTDQERTLEQLRVSEERWQLALRGAGDALWDWDLMTGRIFRSPRWCSMMGYDESEIGETRDDLIRLIHPDDLESTNSAVAVHLAGKTPMFSCEFRLRHKDGTWRWIMDRGQAIWDERGRPVRMAGAHTDITERKAAEDLLALQARTDALTGVANRREFEKLSGELFRMAKESREPLSVCICDLDHFKQVNDFYGHAAGDRVLIGFTAILKRSLRKGDILGRIGGDEFVLALPGIAAKEACKTMERIRQELRGSSFESADGVTFEVTSSFGVAELQPSHGSFGETMEEADRCLYEAKGTGRDRTLAA